MALAEHGWCEAARNASGIRAGLNIVYGRVCCAGVAQAFDLPYTPAEQLLKEFCP